MVLAVAWTVDRADRRALDLEGLSVDYVLLTRFRLVLVDVWCQVRIHTQEVGDAACMVAMPVRQENVRKPNALRSKRGLEQLRPRRLAASSIDNQAVTPGADNVCICTLVRKLRSRRY